MKTVWFLQDFNDTRVNEVFTTKKAVVAEVKRIYGQGQYHTIVKGSIYHFYTPNDMNDYVCSIEKVAIIHNTRKSK